MDYKEALKILNNNLENRYKITEFVFDIPDMFIFWFEDQEASSGGALDYVAVSKQTKEVIRDIGTIMDKLNKLSDEEFDKCKKNIPIAQAN